MNDAQDIMRQIHSKIIQNIHTLSFPDFSILLSKSQSNKQPMFIPAQKVVSYLDKAIDESAVYKPYTWVNTNNSIMLLKESLPFIQDPASRESYQAVLSLYQSLARMGQDSRKASSRLDYHVNTKDLMECFLSITDDFHPSYWPVIRKLVRAITNNLQQVVEFYENVNLASNKQKKRAFFSLIFVKAELQRRARLDSELCCWYKQQVKQSGGDVSEFEGLSLKEIINRAGEQLSISVLQKTNPELAAQLSLSETTQVWLQKIEQSSKKIKVKEFKRDDEVFGKLYAGIRHHIRYELSKNSGKPTDLKLPKIQKDSEKMQDVFIKKYRLDKPRSRMFTRGEKDIHELLKKNGYSFRADHFLEEKYNVDIMLSDYPIVIEINGSNHIIANSKSLPLMTLNHEYSHHYKVNDLIKIESLIGKYQIIQINVSSEEVTPKKLEKELLLKIEEVKKKLDR